jgi:hypothetical protein
MALVNKSFENIFFFPFCVLVLSCQLLSQTVIAFWINTTPALSQFDFDFGILAIFDKVCISF